MGLRGKWGSKGTRRELRRSPLPSPLPPSPLAALPAPIFARPFHRNLFRGYACERSLLVTSSYNKKKRPNVCHFVEMCSCYNIKVDGMLSKILVWLCCITDVIGMILLCVRKYFAPTEKLFSTLIKLFSMKRFP